MHPFHTLLVLFAILSLVALVFLLRWEHHYFLKLNKGNAWLRVRLATIPIALATAAIIIIPARSTSGMEALAFFYILLLTVAPIFWFGAQVSRKSVMFMQEVGQVKLYSLSTGKIIR
ncbi:hypothetical protein MTYP_02026 [Methylophilaceae bacterium]|nr:hypothetical protein MTYP_02026 [Methylophilaceae bacterium]